MDSPTHTVLYGGLNLVYYPSIEPQWAGVPVVGIGAMCPTLGPIVVITCDSCNFLCS